MIKKFFVGTLGMSVNTIIYIIVVLFAIRVITLAYDFSYDVFGDRPVAEASEEIVPIQINDGASTEEVAAILERKGLIRYKYSFVLHVALSKYKGAIKPGSYELSPSMTMDDILEILSGNAENTQTSTE